MYNFNIDQGIICLFFVLRQLSNGCVFICYCLVQAVTVLTVLQSGHTLSSRHYYQIILLTPSVAALLLVRLLVYYLILSDNLAAYSSNDNYVWFNS